FADESSIQRTTFLPPPVDEIVLFSDCQFALPASSPPTYVVVDPNLESPGDARVARLEFRDKQIAAVIVNDGAPRELGWQGAEPSQSTAPTGSTTQIATPHEGAGVVSARLAPGDRWPENDALAILASPPMNSQRWWIGTGEPPASWTHLLPG